MQKVIYNESSHNNSQATLNLLLFLIWLLVLVTKGELRLTGSVAAAAAIGDNDEVSSMLLKLASTRSNDLFLGVVGVSKFPEYHELTSLETVLMKPSKPWGSRDKRLVPLSLEADSNSDFKLTRQISAFSLVFFNGKMSLKTGKK